MTPEHELYREMGCTRTEFLRWLPGATRNAPVTCSGDLYTVLSDQGTVEIALTELPLRRIASIALPVLGVRFRFLAMDEAQRAGFLTWFDHYTRRGGG